MGLPKEQELVLFIRRVFGQAERGERKKLGEEKTRWLALGKTLAQSIGALGGLSLEEGFERDFFVGRLSIHLFHALYPLNTSPKEDETLNERRNKRDEELDAYFGRQFKIEETFEATDDIQRCSPKRALDHAARNAFGIIVQDLKEGGQNQEFALSVIEFFKKGINPQTPLYTPSKQAKENFYWRFERDGKEIAGFRDGP